MAPHDDPRAALRALLAEQGIDDAYPAAVEAEVEALIADPGIDAPDLDDRTALPFVTVDGPGTRDLDQALYVERRGAGFGVQYAIADAAWFVRPGSALLEESVRRGASYYLPGEAVPMLPRPLSEGLVSLSPGVDRRAMVFDMTVDADGVCTSTAIVRARIRSRHQLTFEHVDAVLTGRGQHPVTDPDLVRSLRCFREVGELRERDAQLRGVVAYHREEVVVRMSEGRDARLTAVEVLRNQVEADNAQLSLLCNAEGAALLRDRAGAGDDAQPIYKVHPPPTADSLQLLAARIDACIDAHGLADRWRWRPSELSLSQYVQALPRTEEHVRLTAAISRQSIMVNLRSEFAMQPAPHHGVGAQVYGRFSAPMREVVGVFLHKEIWEALAPTVTDDDGRDVALRERVVAAANRSRTLQRELTAAADGLVIDALFAGDLAQSPTSRPRHIGTVMGIRRGRVYIRLDAPPLDVKVYVDRLDRGYACDEHSAVLLRAGKRVCRLGDCTALRVLGRANDGRWLLDFAD